jgi:hypothetical protein
LPPPWDKEKYLANRRRLSRGKTDRERRTPGGIPSGNGCVDAVGNVSALLRLAAEELILGSLGKLEPLDQQYDQTQRVGFSSGSEGLLVVVWSGLGTNLMSRFEGRSG